MVKTKYNKWYHPQASVGLKNLEKPKDFYDDHMS